MFKNTYSLLSEKISERYKRIIKIFKNFSIICNDERGAIVSTIIGIGGIIAVSGAALLGLYAYVKGKEAAVSLLYDMSSWIYGICYGISQFTTNIFSSVAADIVANHTIITNPTYLVGWNECKNLADMFIVLGFVVVGIATALRVREYEAKKLLWPLIALALLINFSNIFCGVVIDASNIATNTFLSVSDGGIGYTISGKIDQAFHANPAVIDAAKNLNGSELLAASFAFAMMQLILGLTFGYMCIVFIVRQVILAILFILSPLAFFFYIFPPSRHLWTKWWENFLKWCFVGAIAGLFFYIPAQMLTSYDPASADPFVLITELAFFVVGFKIATSSSAAVSGAVMKLASGGVGFAMGAVGMAAGAGKSLGSRMANTRMGQAARNTGGRAMEFMHLRSEGTTGQRTDKQREEVAKNVGNLSETRKTQLATQRAATREGADKKEAAIRDKVKNNNIGDLGKTAEEQNAAIAWVENREKSRGQASTIRRDASKSAPALAAHDTNAVAKIQTEHPNWSETADPSLGGLSKAQHEAVVRSAAKKPEEELNRSLTDSLSPQAIRDSGARMTDRKKESWKRNALQDLDEQIAAMPASTKRTELEDKYTALHSI